MANRIPDIIRFPLVLLVVCLVSAASLSALYGITQPRQAAMEKLLNERALKVVMPEATSFKKIDAVIGGKNFSYKKAYADGNLIGYVAEGRAVGYSSVLRVMVGVDKDFIIKGVKVLYQKETPGLGSRVEEILSKRTWGTIFSGTSPDESGLRPWFQTQFAGKSVPVSVKKDGGRIEAITGATISSRAVCRAVNDVVSSVKKLETGNFTSLRETK